MVAWEAVGTQKLCPHGQRQQAAFLPRLDLVAFRVVASVVDMDLVAAVVGSEEVSAVATEDMAVEEVELDTKVGAHLPDEEALAGRLMAWVMARYLLPTHLQAPAEIVEALGLVGMAAHLSMVA